MTIGLYTYTNGIFCFYKCGEKLKKLQQFYIYKIKTDRLIESKYKINNLDIQQARKNQEVVSISDSELVRTFFRISNRQFSQSEINDLLVTKKMLNKKKNSKQNRISLEDVVSKIDKVLFIPEIISIEFSDRRHSKTLLNKKEIIINEKPYVPFMASTGMIRRNLMLYVESKYSSLLNHIFENGINKSKEVVPAKYGSYFSLYSSSSISVTFPKIAIVPDKTIITTRVVDYSKYPEMDFDSFVEQKEVELSLNAFDGQGLVSPKMAKIWSQELELDYIPSCFIVRASFTKGLCITFDFHRFAKENNLTTLTDIYGNIVGIEDLDAIISESQFKMWNQYFSTENYIENCYENKLGWGITRVSPKEEKNYAFSSYQFIQSLSLKKDDIEKIVNPTKNWLKNVSGQSLDSVLLYLMGDVEIKDNWFDMLESNVKGLLLENELIKDSYFIEFFEKHIEKRKLDSCMGRLVFPANYQFMISDPYAQCCHIFGTEFNPLLAEGECYNQYWDKKESKEIAIVRSPIVHYSEVNKLKIIKTELKDDWFSYINSGIIFPPYGVSLDMAILGGADVDGDICFSTNYQPFIDGKINSLPIFYESLSAEKKPMQSMDSVLKSQADGFGTKVGFLTNIGSSLSSLISEYSPETFEYKILTERYKYIRVAQGLEIDKQKGLVIPNFPKWWTNRKKITEDMNALEKLFHEENNKLVISNQRPYFFKYLYSHMGKKWREEIQGFENISLTKWKLTLEELKELENKDIHQIKLLGEFKKYSSFIDNESVMNQVSHHMEEFLKSIKTVRKELVFDYKKLLSKEYKNPSKENIDKITLLFKEYKSLKRDLLYSRESDKKEYESYDEIKKYINKKAYSAICSDSKEISDLVVYLCYELLGKNSKKFLWDCFGEEVVSVLLNKNKNKFVRIPLKNKDGSIEYLFSNYGMYMVNI